LDEHLIQSRGGIPIDITQVIAERVLPVVGELNAAAALKRPLLALHLSGKRPSRGQRKHLQLFQKSCIKDRALLRHGSSSRSPSSSRSSISSECFPGWNLLRRFCFRT